MARFKRVGSSPAVLVAVLASVAAVGGTALAGSEPPATASKSAKKIAKQAKKKAKKANKAAKAAQGSADSAQGAADSAQSTADGIGADLAGVKVRPISYRRTDPDATETTILDLNGYQLIASCAGGDLAVSAKTSVENSYYSSAGLRTGSTGGATNEAQDTQLSPGEDPDLLPDFTTQVNMHTEFAAPSGAAVTVKWTAADRGPTSSTEPDCGVTGHAFGTG